MADRPWWHSLVGQKTIQANADHAADRPYSPAELRKVRATWVVLTSVFLAIGVVAIAFGQVAVASVGLFMPFSITFAIKRAPPRRRAQLLGRFVSEETELRDNSKSPGLIV